MVKTAQKNKPDQQILHFEVSQKRWLRPCNARVGTLLHEARGVVPDSSFVPENQYHSLQKNVSIFYHHTSL